MDPSTYRFYNYTVNENGALVTYGADGDQAFYSTDFFSRRAAEIVTRLAPSDQPFFLSLAYLAPHGGQPREDDDPSGLGTPAVAPRHKDASRPSRSRTARPSTRPTSRTSLAASASAACCPPGG